MRLWVTRATPLRFFLVPDGEALPAGTVVVESTASQTATVALAAMARWEVSVRQARLWFRDHEGDVQAERQAQVQAVSAALDAAAAALSQIIDSPQLRTLLVEVGLDAERLVSEPAATGAMIEALAAVVAQGTAPGETEPKVRKILRQHGHLKANSRLRRDPASLERLLAALQDCLAPQRS